VKKFFKLWNILFGKLSIGCATDEELRTYGDVSRKEDVLGLVEILTATEDYFLNNLGKTTATDMVHITLTDTLRSVATAAVAEGGDYTMLARTTPSRLQNIVEIVAIPYSVTRSQQQITKHTGVNELARQTAKAIKEWADAAEFDIVRSTLTSGASGTTPKMSKLKNKIYELFKLWKAKTKQACETMSQMLFGKSERIFASNYI